MGDGVEDSVVIDVDQASDANSVVAVGRWHQPALAEVYRRHGGAVHALSRRILQSDPAAEEITQEVFLDLWKHPEKFDAQRGTLRSFLLARTHGKSVDFVRSEVARRRREERTSYGMRRIDPYNKRIDRNSDDNLTQVDMPR